MKAPMSKEIFRVLQNPKAAVKLIDAVLEERTNPQMNTIVVTIDGKEKIYKRVGAIGRKRPEPPPGSSSYALHGLKNRMS